MKKVKHKYITTGGPSYANSFGIDIIICSLVMVFRGATLRYYIQFNDESERFRSLRNLVHHKHDELDRYDAMTKQQVAEESAYSKLSSGY